MEFHRSDQSSSKPHRFGQQQLNNKPRLKSDQAHHHLQSQSPSPPPSPPHHHHHHHSNSKQILKPPPSTSSSTLVNDEDALPDTARTSNSIKIKSQVLGKPYRHQTSISAFELPQGVHLHDLQPQPNTLKQRTQPLVESNINQYDKHPQSYSLRSNLDDAHTRVSHPRLTESSTSSEDHSEPFTNQPTEPSTTPPSHPSTSSSLPHSHLSPPRNPRSTAQDHQRLKNIMNSPKRTPRPVFHSQTHTSIRASNVNPIHQNATKLKDKASEEELDDEIGTDMNQTQKQDVDFQRLGHQAMAVLDRVLTASKVEVPIKQSLPRESSSRFLTADPSRSITTRPLKPPLAHLARRMKIPPVTESDLDALEDDCISSATPLVTVASLESPSQRILNAGLDKISDEIQRSTIENTFKAYPSRKSVSSFGRQDETRLKTLLTPSPPAHPPAALKTHKNFAAESTHLATQKQSENQSSSTTSTNKRQDNPNIANQSRHLLPDSRHQGQVSGHRERVLSDAQQAGHKSESHNQPSWPYSPFLKPKSKGRGSDSSDSEDGPDHVHVAGKPAEHPGPGAPSRSIRKTVAFAVTGPAAREVRSGLRVSTYTIQSFLPCGCSFYCSLSTAS